MLTQVQLKNLLHYDPKTGIFTWKEDRGIVKKGDIAGCKDKLKNGKYIKYCIKILGKNIYHTD